MPGPQLTYNGRLGRRARVDAQRELVDRRRRRDVGRAAADAAAAAARLAVRDGAADDAPAPLAEHAW